MGAEVLSEAVQEMAVRRVLLAMSRFGEDVREVTVRLAAPANPLGGFDQRCRMRARLQATGDIHVEAINGKMEAAVARAAARLATRVGWALAGATGHGFRAAAPFASSANHDGAPPAPPARRRRLVDKSRRRRRF